MNGTGTAPIEIRREKVFVPPGLSTKEIREKYDLKPAVACVARHRGWFVKNYSKKQVVIDPSRFDLGVAYCVARKVYKQNFSRRPLAISMRDDLIQEAVTRMYELSGKYTENGKYTINYHFHWVAHNAIQSFLKTWEKQMRYSELLEEWVRPIRRGVKRKYHPTYGWLYC